MEEDDLDVSWLNDEKRILSIDHNYQREPLESILFHFCYTNNDTIHKVLTEKYIFRDNNSTVPLCDLEKIIEEKSKMDVTKYDFAEYVTFIVDLEPEHINSFDPSNTTFFKPLPIVSDVSFSKSIYIFHPLNSLFFLFKQRSSLKQPHKATKSMKKVAFSSKKFTRRIYL
jgi:hypothetical protein